jgi:hypothetical protein
MARCGRNDKIQKTYGVGLAGTRKDAISTAVWMADGVGEVIMTDWLNNTPCPAALGCLIRSEAKHPTNHRKVIVDVTYPNGMHFVVIEREWHGHFWCRRRDSDPEVPHPHDQPKQRR